MNFILNVAFQFILIFCGKGFTYKTLIFASLIISCFSMLLLPLSVAVFSGLTGFLITCFIILFQGLANAVVLSCFYGIIGYMKDEYRVAFSTGSGIAGILMNLIKYALLILLPDNSDSTAILSAIIFFSITVLVLILTIIAVLVIRINIGCL
jgi:hypothetical protein